MLGTIADLPIDYVAALTQANTLPLWPNLRNVLPYERPTRQTTPVLWKYEDIRPLLLKAGRLTPIERAERRVLVLTNPGLGADTMRVTPTIYAGLQLILPRETAPNHRHTPSAIRFVVEGDGAFTTVSGEKCPMERGDLILTPSGLWHEHSHEGSGPVIWLDVLDLPLVYGIEASYCVEGKSQNSRDCPDSSQTSYRRAGLVPYASLNKSRPEYPMLRFPWREVRQALMDLAAATPKHEAVRLAYVNPETGQECLPVLGFSALMLRPGERLRLPRHSASGLGHIIEGQGHAIVDEAELSWHENDTIALPTHAEIQLTNGSPQKPAFVFLVDDAPLQRKLRFYEQF